MGENDNIEDPISSAAELCDRPWAATNPVSDRVGQLWPDCRGQHGASFANKHMIRGEPPTKTSQSQDRRYEIGGPSMWQMFQLGNFHISPANMRVIKLLVGNTPKSVADLIREMKVTRTAVTEQLNELVAAGLVQRQMQRLPGRGRPRHVYSTTPAALALLFARNQELVLPAIWRALREIGGPELVQKVVDRVSEQLSHHYLRRITAEKPEDRVRQFVEVLHEEGVLVDVQEENGKVYVRQRSCPFVFMYEENRTACLLDQEIISGVLGIPVRQVACRHEGAPCCVFEVGTNST